MTGGGGLWAILFNQRITRRKDTNPNQVKGEDVPYFGASEFAMARQNDETEKKQQKKNDKQGEASRHRPYEKNGRGAKDERGDKPMKSTRETKQGRAEKAEKADKAERTEKNRRTERKNTAPAEKAPRKRRGEGAGDGEQALPVGPFAGMVQSGKDNFRHSERDARNTQGAGQEKTRGKGKRKLTLLPTGKLKVMMLGGLMEIGKNLAVIEYEDDMIVVDCGLGFPDDDMPGIDLVIPDVTYLRENLSRLRGIFITHGHEDHIGGLPYVLKELGDVPVYATRLTLGILENKLREHTYDTVPVLQTVEAGDIVDVGALSVEFIHVNHSIADACCLAIHTPLGTVVHSGDFKLDITPIDGDMMNLTRLGQLGKEGVLLLMCESTNAERPGFTPSERIVGASLDSIFMRNKTRRIIIATFSSNVHRVQQIINTSVAYGRKVAVTGRSMINILKAAIDLGYTSVPEGVLIDIAEIKNYPPEQVTIVTTGSQGEPMSALHRMALGSHQNVAIGPSDLVVLSAHAIPGNEKDIDRIVNELSKIGATVFRDNVTEVHVSGHACQEELKLLQALTKPKYFMPIHGEYKHLLANKQLAEYMGTPADRIFISDLGKVLEIDAAGARFNGTVPSGQVLVDGYGVGDVGNIVLRDRRHLAQDGLIVVVVTIDKEYGTILSGPDIVSRGFVYVREAEELMDGARQVAMNSLEKCLDERVTDWAELKTRVKDDLSKYLFTKTHRKPMILPMVTSV